MSTITIDSQLYHNARLFAEKQNISIKELVEGILAKAFSDSPAAPESCSWHDYKISPKVMSMTFKNRKDIPEDYKQEYAEAIKERLP